MWNVLSYLTLFQRLTSSFVNLIIDNLNWLHLALLPIGALVPYPLGAVDNYIRADGSVVAQASFPLLYATIGTFFNTGSEGAGNFRLPNPSPSLGTGMYWYIRYQ